ncbi:CapA family protein [Streptomyces sp. NPDC059524]|uniref:CapA family protein n=1 Tax=Streptomyces sp. NPDC059524 TaxID=3346856 RepID=UPI00367C07F4
MTSKTRSSTRGSTRRTALVLTAAALGLGAGCAAPGAGPGAAPPHKAAPAPAPAVRPFTLAASGDVLPHSSIIEKAHEDAGGTGYDFRSMLAGMKPVVSGADVAICHMETVYGAQGDYSGYPDFKSPPEVAAGLKETGYDSCSAASNHTLDDGADGIARTLDAFDRAGVKHTGSGRTAAEGRAPAWLKAGGARIAQLAYTYDTNDHPMPEGKPWSVNLMERQRIVEDARAARRAGADVVVVSLHWGTEWQDEPDERQVGLGRELTASTTNGRPDIDLILGTHAHVPQAYEKVNGTWIVYGMGDQIAGEMFNHDGARDARGNMSSVGRFTFAPPARDGQRWQVTKAEFVPQWFDVSTGRVVDLGRAIDEGADLGGIRDAVRQVVLSRGAARDGLVMAK